MSIPFKFDAGKVVARASSRKWSVPLGLRGWRARGCAPVPGKRGNMRQTTFSRSAAIAVAVCLAAGAARADDDQDCDNIMDELKKLSERLMNTTDPKGIGPVCAATGQLLGIIKASREVAAECYDEGRKRDQILLTFDKASKDMESKIDSVCK